MSGLHLKTVLSKRLFGERMTEKMIVVVTAILVVTLIIDMELSNVADILHNSVSSNIGVFVFAIISVVYLSNNYYHEGFSQLRVWLSPFNVR